MDSRTLAGMLIRIAVTYVYLVAVLRLSGKRVLAHGTPFDFVAAISLGDMPDDVIWGEVPVAQGLVAMGTLILLHLLVIYAGYRNLRFDRLVAGTPASLIADGAVIEAMGARERVNEDEVRAMLREQHVEDPREVEEAVLEPSGTLSVLKRHRSKPAEGRDRSRLWRTKP